MDEVLRQAKSCRHYAMCKIDFLESGLCASGVEKQFVSFFPQGRMDLYAALVEGQIPVTEKLVEIADSCDLCGKCDFQCYFVTGMKPTLVMKELKKKIEDFISSGGIPLKSAEDHILKEIRKIVGEEWAMNDRAIALTYSHDPFPMAAPVMPEYVVMPSSKEEISQLLKLFKKENIKWAVRGNGSSVISMVMSEGAVIDMNRMKEVSFDEKNWNVRVGPGVSAFDLQKEATNRGYRVNVAEPAALVCANIICSGIFSTFSAAYGTGGENLINAEFVSPDGKFFSLNDKRSPNLYAFNKTGEELPGICTSVSMKLHPVTGDEEGVLLPFVTFEKAVEFAKDCSQRRIGLSIAILGEKYISAFLSPTAALAKEVRKIFSEKLGISFLVVITGDKYAIGSVKAMGIPFIDQRLFRILSLGLPSLTSAGWIDLLTEDKTGKPFSWLNAAGLAELAETALDPSAESLAQSVDPELRSFFEKLYSRPQMTDLLWLSMFRIVSSRMGREKHMSAWIIYMPVEFKLIDEINNEFKRIAGNYGLSNYFGFLTPVDCGKRCILEYDYFFDQTDQEDISRMQKATIETSAMIEMYAERTKTVRWIKHVFNQGFARMENMLYDG